MSDHATPPPARDPVLASLRAALAAQRAGATAARQAATATPPASAPPVDQARALYGRAMGLLDAATAASAGRDVKAIAGALREAREQLKLLGQFTGDLATGQAVQVIFEHPAARDFVNRALGHVQAILAERLGEDAVREAMAELGRRIEAERSAAGAAAPPAARGGNGGGRALGA